MPHEVILSIESIGDDSPIPVDSGAQLLSPVEMEKANSFRFQIHRKRYIRGRALLRTKLGRLLNSSASEIVIEEEKRGKPFVPGSNLSFNLSHSEDLAMFAFSNSLARLGVDIERFDRDSDIEGLSEHCFTPRECRELQELPRAERRVLFFRIWTAKEARMKLTGEGMHLEPREIELTFSKGIPSGFHKPFPGGEILEALQYSEHGAVGSIVADQAFKVQPMLSFPA